MIRLLLWIVIIYFGWRVIRTIFAIKQRSTRRDDNIPPFSNVEDADFEDITNKTEPPDQQETKK